LPSVASLEAPVEGPAAAAPGDKVLAVDVAVVVFVVAAPDVLVAVFARLVWLPCSGSRLLLLALICLPWAVRFVLEVPFFSLSISSVRYGFRLAFCERLGEAALAD